MTTAQTKLYWIEWSKARAAAQLNDGERRALHLKALGYPVSSKDLTNDEFDKVLAAFRALSAPYNLNSQLRQQDQPRTRLLHRIRDQFACLALFVDHPCNYVAAILRDRFHVEQLEDLRADAYTRPRVDASHAGPKDEPITDSDLEQLRNTLSRCLSALRRKRGWTEHEMCREARVECFRPACAECRNAKNVAQVSQPACVEEPF